MNFKFISVPLMVLSLFMTSSCSDDDSRIIHPDRPDVPTPQPPVEEYDTPAGVLFSTFKGRVMCGYQGWFTAPGDECSSRGWTHWTATGIGKFEPGYCSIDFWPDVSEYEKTYDTPFVHPDGTTAKVFSSADKSTADLHFKWMKEYGIGGAIIQRFKSTVEACASGSDRHSLDVLANCIEASKKYNIAIMVEYDLSGLGSDSDLDMLIRDWDMLNEKFHLTDPSVCPTYLWEKGKPMLGFFAVGLNKGDSTPEQYIYLFDNMKGRDGEKGKLSYFAGTGYAWLSSGGSAKPFIEWEEVYKRCAVISPWAVGNFSSVDVIESRMAQVANDIKWCKRQNVVYAPVAYPGFSWRNTQTKWKNNGTAFDWDPKNCYDMTPRERGAFLWKLLGRYRELGAEAAFVAMFDEIDEGTAIFKCVKSSNTPINTNQYFPEGKFVGYDDDLDPAFYMKLVGEAGKWYAGAEGYSSETLPNVN